MHWSKRYHAIAVVRGLLANLSTETPLAIVSRLPWLKMMMAHQLFNRESISLEFVKGLIYSLIEQPFRLVEWLTIFSWSDIHTTLIEIMKYVTMSVWYGTILLDAVSPQTNTPEWEAPLQQSPLRSPTRSPRKKKYKQVKADTKCMCSNPRCYETM